MADDLEKEFLKAKLEIQNELIKKRGGNSSTHKTSVKRISKKSSTKSLKELRAFEGRKKQSNIDIRLIKTPLDLFFYNYSIDLLTKAKDETTPFLDFVISLVNKNFKESERILQFLPEGEEKAFDEFLVKFFSDQKVAIQSLAQQASKLGKYKDLATFMVMAYAVKDLELVRKVAQQMLISNSSMELRFLNSVIEYFTKNDVIEIIPSIVISLRKFPKSPMLNNIIGYVNLKKGDPITAKDYFSKAAPFICAVANLEEMDESNNSDSSICPKILYLRIKKLVDVGEVDTAKSMLSNFTFDHPYKFLAHYYVYGPQEENDKILSKFSPKAKFYFKSRLLATAVLKSLKPLNSYKEALTKKYNIKGPIRVELDIDTYEFLYQLLGGIYCILSKK